jgi:hypothetical protein
MPLVKRKRHLLYIYTYATQRTIKLPIAWLSHFFMRLPFSLIRHVSSDLPLCLDDGG